jgi:hypothetical protein
MFKAYPADNYTDLYFRLWRKSLFKKWMFVLHVLGFASSNVLYLTIYEINNIIVFSMNQSIMKYHSFVHSLLLYKLEDYQMLNHWGLFLSENKHKLPPCLGSIQCVPTNGRATTMGL